jgi:8-oxo-dGTP pyrophosphatase MutT (NUDIX family)
MNLQNSDPELVPVRDAATVMLLRDGAEGIEVCMLRRNLNSDFVGGAYVFPGGAVDPDDAGPDVEALVTGWTDVSASRQVDVESGGLAFWVAAIRESFEEAGLLLAHHADGRIVDLDADAGRWAEHRASVDTGEGRLVDVCVQEGLRLATDRIEYFSRWITPLGAPRRYDTRFFVALAPEGQTPVHDDREVIATVWITPATALAEHGAGRFEMIFPTVRTLESLQQFERASDVVAHARSIGQIVPVRPRIIEHSSGLRIVLPGDRQFDAVTSFPIEP